MGMRTETNQEFEHQIFFFFQSVKSWINEGLAVASCLSLTMEKRS